MTTRDPIVPVLLEKVYALIAEKLEMPQQSLITQLAQRLFANIDNDDLLQRNESDMYGATLSLWNHLSDVNMSDISVRVFNPKLSQDGWQSTHTVVEIVTPDSPFLVDSVKMALARLDMTSHFMLHGRIVLAVTKAARSFQFVRVMLRCSKLYFILKLII